MFTHVRRGWASTPFKFNINAATSVRFRGERFVHAWLMHAFSGQSAPDVELTAQVLRVEG